MNSSSSSGSRSARPEETEIDLMVLFKALKKHIALIIIVALIFGAASYFGTLMFVRPTYRTSFRVYVNNSQQSGEEKTYISSSDVSASRSLAGTYGEIIKGRSVLTQAADSIGLDGSYSELSKMVEISTSTTSEIITVYVTARSKETALEYAQSIAEVAERQIASIVDGSSMRVIDEAYLPGSRYAPSYSKNAVIGAILGGILICGIIVIKELMDDRVKAEDSLEESFGIVVLGSVPNYWTAMKSGDKYGYYGRKKE